MFIRVDDVTKKCVRKLKRKKGRTEPERKSVDKRSHNLTDLQNLLCNRSLFTVFQSKNTLKLNGSSMPCIVLFNHTLVLWGCVNAKSHSDVDQKSKLRSVYKPRSGFG